MKRVKCDLCVLHKKTYVMGGSWNAGTHGCVVYVTKEGFLTFETRSKRKRALKCTEVTDFRYLFNISIVFILHHRFFLR